MTFRYLLNIVSFTVNLAWVDDSNMSRKSKTFLINFPRYVCNVSLCKTFVINWQYITPTDATKWAI